jgi:hypothetical protein
MMLKMNFELLLNFHSRSVTDGDIYGTPAFGGALVLIITLRSGSCH